LESLLKIRETIDIFKKLFDEKKAARGQKVKMLALFEI